MPVPQRGATREPGPLDLELVARTMRRLADGLASTFGENRDADLLDVEEIDVESRLVTWTTS